MKATQVDALRMKPGPTQSGINNYNRTAVGGIVEAGVPLWVYLLLLLLALPVAHLLYRNRSVILGRLSPVLSRLLRI